MNRKRTPYLFTLIIVGSFLITACGGGGGAQQPPTAPAATQPAAAQNTEAPAAGGYQGVPVTGGGSITGKVTYTGAPVEPEQVTVDKDTEKCGTSKEVVKVMTDSSGGLANAVVRITNITSGKPLDSLGDKFVLDQKDCEYVPAVVVVPAGATLTVLNNDDILHNVHTTPFDNPPLNVAQPADQKEIQSPEFTVPENIPVGCDVHKWMNATIVVVDNPYAVATGEDGSFTLTDVPAGEYTIEVWHEELGTQTATVKVEEGQEAKADVEFK